jgi:recombination protein RecT
MSNELTTRKNSTPTIRDHLEGDAFKRTVAAALPKHLPPDRFIRVALTAMTRTPKLAQCDQASFFQCLLTLSALGLEPDGRRAHLIPFENRKRGVTECQLIVDYKGIVELAMRSGEVSNIHADVVCETDEFEFDRGVLVKHKIDFRKDRGEAYAVYAIARFKDGGEKCEVMTCSDVEAVRQRSRAGNNGPWVTDWREMAKKTVFRRLSKWLPLSSEYRDALDADADATIDAPSIPIVATVNTPFQIAEPAQQEDDGDLAPTPAPVEKPAPVTDGPSIKDQLAEIVTGAGHTFDDFLKWAIESGNIEKAAQDAVTSFDEVPQAIAARFVKSKTGMLKGIALTKEALAV